MNIERRPATAADLPLLYQIFRAAMREHVIKTAGGWNEIEQAQEFEKTTNFALHEILLDEGKPFGFVNIVPMEGRTHLNRLCLIPEYQSRGIGTRLLENLIKSSASGTAITLQVFPDNPAYRLYRRLGFKKVKTTDTHIHMAYNFDAKKSPVS